MGMDVYGKRPASEVGEYFRRNVWGWHPLWNYVEDNYPEIAELVEHAHSNDGDGLNAKKSMELAQLLESDLKTGKAIEYVESRNKRLSELPMEDCKYCDATGIRSDSVGVQWGLPDRELSEEKKIVLGRDKGTCNGCDGVGQTSQWETNYYLDVDDIKEFADFLQACGGFEIC